MKGLFTGRRLAVAVTSGIAAVIVFFLLFFTVFHEESTVQDADVVTESSEEESLQDSDDELASVYMSLISGMTFSADDGKEYGFGTDGTYSGYFDEENQDTDSCTYAADVQDGNVRLILCDTETGSYVTYQMEFDEDGNLVLMGDAGKVTLTY